MVTAGCTFRVYHRWRLLQDGCCAGVVRSGTARATASADVGGAKGHPPARCRRRPGTEGGGGGGGGRARRGARWRDARNYRTAAPKPL